MQAFILAAGLGTRLRPLTDTKPKALIEVGGVTLLERLIIKLKAAGFDHIVINTHHFAQQIYDFVKEKDNFGINILFSDETDLLRDTGGAIKLALDRGLLTEPFLIHNVDIISNLDLNAYYHDFLRSTNENNKYSVLTELEVESKASLVVKQRDTQRYLLFDDAMKLRGWENIKTNEFKPEGLRSYIENLRVDTPVNEGNIPKDMPFRRFAFSGIHMISPQVATYMKGWPARFSIIDFYLSIIDRSLITGYSPEGLDIIDVGKVDEIERFFI